MHRPGAVLALLLALPALTAAAPRGSLIEGTAGPYRIQVERVAVFETRSLEGPGRSQSVQRSCALTLRIEGATPQEQQSIVGIAPDVQAKDDTGTRLRARGPILPTFTPGGSPNESRLVVTLEAPDRRATRLLDVAGDLVLYRTVVPARAEFDLSAEPGGRTEALGGAKITLQKVESSGDECVLSLRVEGEPGAVIADRAASLQRAIPVLLTRSGARHRTGSFNATSGVSPQGTPFTEQKLTFRGLKEAPARLIFDALLKSDPDRHIPFRLAEVPLPSEGASHLAPIPAPRRGTASAGRSESTAVAVTGTLASANGGGIAGGIEAAGSPGGRVAFGLSRPQAGGWSAVRWIEAPTDAAGIAHITGLRPGHYRVRRTFTPAAGSPLAAGVWKNEDVMVVVVAGKETLLPPLQRVGR